MGVEKGIWEKVESCDVWAGDVSKKLSVLPALFVTGGKVVELMEIKLDACPCTSLFSII